jgi:hypothetical protein
VHPQAGIDQLQPVDRHRLRPVEQRGQHRRQVAQVIVDRLLAAQHQVHAFALHQQAQRFEQRRGIALARTRIEQDRRVRPHRQCRAQHVLRHRGAAAHHRDPARLTGLAQAHGLLHGDFVERVQRHLEAVGIDPGAVAAHAHLDVVIDHALDGYQYVHVHLLLQLRTPRPGRSGR